MIEVKEGQIIFFENKTKQNNQPDYRGAAKFNGVEVEVSLWIKEGQKGKYLSGQIKEAYKKQLENENKKDTSEAEEEILPF
jgi:hypothetical protein